MPELTCPNGHASTEDDFCTICGTKMHAPPALTNCPDCGLARDSGGGIFCEFCGFNFNTREHGELKAIPTPQTPAAQTPVREWQAVITVDPSLRTAESPEAPEGVVAITIPLIRETHLIGRRSEKRAIFPEIPLDSDDAVSHRHALITRTSGGGLTLRDIGSSNGTTLNGKPLEPLTDVALNPGDELTLGHWTRIRIQ